jgi:hypothetical protein
MKSTRPRGRSGSPVRVPEPGEGKRGEAGYLSYLLRQAAGAVRLRLERSLADLGVTPPQYLAGLIDRSAHPVHGRVQVITLTRAGRTLLSRSKERAVKADTELKVGISAGNEAVIRRWLVGLAKRAE